MLTFLQLELQIRLCIRDSLFRLAQSAMQRQYPIDTSSTNTGSRDNVLGNKEIYNHERLVNYLPNSSQSLSIVLNRQDITEN